VLTLSKGKINANGANVVVLIVSPLKNIMEEQIEDNDNVLLPMEEAKYKLVFGKQRKTLCMQNSKTCYRTKILH